MLLRVRVSLPDRPGSLGQLARTLGVAGADIVQVVVLERLAGRAIDDFTVSWPAGASLDRLRAGLAAMPGVRVDGLWRAIGSPVTGGGDAQLLGQLASNPQDGLATLVDAAPGLLAADWAVALVVPSDWARRCTVPGITSGPGVTLGAVAGPVPAVAPASGGEPGATRTVYASWQAPEPLDAPDVRPLRARAMSGRDGTRYASVPFGRGGLVLLLARMAVAAADAGLNLPERLDRWSAPATDPGEAWLTPEFHSTELDRIAQIVGAAAGILGDRLDHHDRAAALVGRPKGAAP